MKFASRTEFVATEVLADVIAHVVIKTVIDPLINTFLPKSKKSTDSK